MRNGSLPFLRLAGEGAVQPESRPTSVLNADVFVYSCPAYHWTARQRSG